MGQSGVACECQPIARAAANCQQDCHVVTYNFSDGVDPMEEDIAINCRLLRASAEGDTQAIMQALEEGAKVDTRLPMRIRMAHVEHEEDGCDCPGTDLAIEEEPEWVPAHEATSASMTPLMHAAKEGHVKAVRLLLQEGADLELCDHEGMQPLHLAAWGASFEVCSILLEARADPHRQDHDDRDPFLCVPAEALVGPGQRKWFQLLRSTAPTKLEVMEDRIQTPQSRGFPEVGDPFDI